jgi:integrase
MKRRNVLIGRRKSDGSWYVNRYENGKRRRTFHRSKREAEGEASRLRAEIAATGEAWTNLAAAERARMFDLWKECEKLGVDPFELVRLYRVGILKAPESRSLQAVLDEWITSKQAAKRSARYLKSMESVLRAFIKGRETMPVSAVRIPDVETWLASRPPAGRADTLGRLKIMFRFAVDRGYRHDNPCEKLDTPRRNPVSPSHLTPEQTGGCLAFLHNSYPRGLAWFVLTTLCGLRPEEAQQTTWAQIAIDNGSAHVVVEAQTSKMQLRRVVAPLAPAVEWLRMARELGSELPISAQVRRRTIDRLRKTLGLATWTKSLTRHTSATYWLAMDGNPLVIAEQLGHSVAELKTHYRALVTRSEAERFWSLCTVEAVLRGGRRHQPPRNDPKIRQPRIAGRGCHNRTPANTRRTGSETMAGGNAPAGPFSFPAGRREPFLAKG